MRREKGRDTGMVANLQVLELLEVIQCSRENVIQCTVFNHSILGAG